MKKILILIISLMAVFSLSACGALLKDVDTLKDMITEMNLIDTDSVYTDDTGSIDGNGASIIHDDESYIMGIYTGDDKMAMLEFSYIVENDVVYIESVSIGYTNMADEFYISQDYDGSGIGGNYHLDMTADEWADSISYYTVDTIFKILVDLEIIIAD